MRQEVGQLVGKAVVGGTHVVHPIGREPAQTDGEDEQQRHPDQEVGRRVEDQRRPVAQVIDEAAASPARVGAETDPEDDRDDLAQAEQDHRGPDPVGQDVDDRQAPIDEREAEVTLRRGREIGHELVGDDRLVETPPFAGGRDRPGT